MDGNQNGVKGNTIAGQDFKKPRLVEICILFSITILLFIFIGYRVQDRDFYSGVLITEVGLIMLPALLYLLFFRYDLKTVLRLHGTRPLNFLVTFCIMLFALPLAGVFNLLNLLLVNSIFGKVILQQPPAANNGQELLLNILVIAVSAGLCEEFLFRGVLQRGFEERFGAVRAILLAAFLFSLTHMDFQKIFGTLLLGALIGFIVHRTHSLYCGIFAHFTNNALAVLFSYVSNKLMSMFQGTEVNVPEEIDLNSLFSTFGALPPQQLIMVFFIYGFMFLFVAALFILLIYAMIRLNPGRSARNSFNNPAAPASDAFLKPAPVSADSGAGVKGLLWLLPGILLIAGMYFFEVFRFTGAESGLVDMVRRLLGG